MPPLQHMHLPWDIPKSDGLVIPNTDLESFDTACTMTGNDKRKRKAASYLRQTLHYGFSPILRLLLFFQIPVGLTDGLLQSSLSVVFDSILLLIGYLLSSWFHPSTVRLWPDNRQMSARERLLAGSGYLLTIGRTCSSSLSPRIRWVKRPCSAFFGWSSAASSAHYSVV